MDTREVKVTVVCITYNHEEFIAQALDSFLMQKTNFRFQIFVGEDHGPDRTAEIVREYAEKYPDIVVPFLREKNMGAQRNLIDLCNHATSPYIAFCEGDDYWTDEYKLQKQFDYMESNPELRVCFAKAEITAPEDWFLRSYYKTDSEGKMIFPDCDPSYKKKDGLLEASSFINFLQAHTSTIFYRWDYELKIPEWYYDGYIGDWPLFLMQLGNGVAGFLPDVVSVYRRSDVGVYMSKSMDEHFMKTRQESVRVMLGMLQFYEENYPGEYPKVMIENRIKRDVVILVQTAMKVNDWDKLVDFFKNYPEAGKLAFQAFTSFYFDSQRMTGVYSWEGNKIVARDRYFMHLLAPFVKATVALKKIAKKYVNKCKKAVVYAGKFLGYWCYMLIPKDASTWAFSGFYKRNYVDNTKYFYEYICKNHKEINAVWFTQDKDVYKQLQDENKKVYMMRSLKGIWTMARAKIAVTDHFAMSDYTGIYGYNHGTKIVQLWHGVGFKSMGKDKEVLNTTVPGVRYSNDILPEDGVYPLGKRIKYFFCAPVRELFERYFLFVCPGQERIEMIGKVWNIPEERYFMSGHPRNYPLYKDKFENKHKVLYAPTYRWSGQQEKKMIELCLDALPEIQALMEKIDGEFTIRLHPHTWRNYQAEILYRIKDYPRIVLDTEKDIYQTLGSYSVIISDYSSIALDFAMIDRPTIYMIFDFEWFSKYEPGFNMDFLSNITGPATYNWKDTLIEIEKYIEHPEKDSKLREGRCAYFFDKAANDSDNSERIYQEIKRRLKI
ncbi:CDP-glycerol glycerophosphotransferase family protein [uncultured Clostridium sp.]|uniref:bifunctional glycosyltransferase/CDP-glycerol:glycerophosphate glycerophosphotransferase n=1 Tax=uncultured Clostridium sp. TaxID=59620 RepID=UPI0025E049B5|nr:CDP-glycerol glycerophosphotransferase family protein [uncultured Clostridium sp.]